MKVVKRGAGTRGGLWTRRVKCTGRGNGDAGCGAILRLAADDLFYTISHSYDGSSDLYVTIECPECRTWTDITEKGIPQGILDRLTKRYPSPAGGNNETPSVG